MLVVGFSAGVEVSGVVGHIPSVSAVIVGVAGVVAADAPKLAGSGRSAKHPERLVGVVLALVDVNEQLRLGLFQWRQGKQGRGDYKGAKSQTFTVCGGGGGGGGG